MAVCSGMLCGKPWNLRESTLHGEEEEDAQHIAVCCEREYCCSSSSSSVGCIGTPRMKSPEFIASKHPAKLWSADISAAWGDRNAYRKAAPFLWCISMTVGYRDKTSRAGPWRWAQSNLKPLQKKPQSVHSCHRAQLQSWQGAQLGLS